ncbi:hypothetical protein BJB45_12545 [Halomonas huangheensis]|uniref:Uncharacterized protein n=1 Tax=Halomonas huangheensis TaxID=1178482 RepID=W1NAP2_9GAMM|nr:hypothetical protein BJB45_12545 [Halomonas huangheensis]
MTDFWQQGAQQMGSRVMAAISMTIRIDTKDKFEIKT